MREGTVNRPRPAVSERSAVFVVRAFGARTACCRFVTDALHKSQPSCPVRELQLVPTMPVDCSLGGARERIWRATVCLIDTSALGHVSLYCSIDDTLEVLNV